ncbi:hypothetical protein BKA14_004514 [Actinoplanes abujensis]|uniref:Uncharacterized protein n=1 Tax=Paractinoplanes abujensis TaxID=882441 RepID=A0A7W7CTE2_9ACTN|nr:hypothetical protein [Actinoplanes abujensis]
MPAERVVRALGPVEVALAGGDASRPGLLVNARPMMARRLR